MSHAFGRKTEVKLQKWSSKWRSWTISFGETASKIASMFFSLSIGGGD
ncbi:hypothetical protein X740_05100 [Mesorhizobium sp. LNHC221B00]|nr:hypothetical protein X740_05100 [Mesorhizobium sp. LNHC221B00]